MQPDKHFIRSRVLAFRYAAAGIAHLLVTQKNAQIQMAAKCLVVIAGAWLCLSSAEWCWIVLATGGVWTAEAFNTALECLCDATHPAQHPLIGKAKDLAAGSVLLAAFAAIVIGAFVLIPHLPI
jgi:diacylglycerol kinase (ATP)